MVRYLNRATREIKGEYVGMAWPFSVGMTIDYHSRGGYLKLHMKVEEFGHTIAREEFAEKFTAETPEKLFMTLDKFAERATHVAKIDEDVHFHGELGGPDSALEFKQRVTDALYSEVNELMAMM